MRAPMATVASEDLPDGLLASCACTNDLVPPVGLRGQKEINPRKFSFMRMVDQAVSAVQAGVGFGGFNVRLSSRMTTCRRIWQWTRTSRTGLSASAAAVEALGAGT
jgi:hypothetical protein